jgi:hypothetical protein
MIKQHLLLHKLPILLFFFFFLPISSFGKEYGYFIPPKDWNLAQPEKPSPCIKALFIGKNPNGFSPSINLTTEKTNLSLKDYLSAVKKLYKEDPLVAEWKDLGPFPTQLGEGNLSQLDKQISSGTVRLMQLITIKNHVAYVLTAGAIKEEFAKYYKEFAASFSSFNVIQDAKAAISSESKKTLLKNLQEDLLNNIKKLGSSCITLEESFYSTAFQQNFWIPFQQKILSEFSEMGNYWQMLTIQETQNNLLQQGKK